MQSASLYLSAGNLSRTGFKSIAYLEDHIELWVDTRGASAWQLESSATLEGVKWQPLQALNGGNGWQQLLIPHTPRFLRLQSENSLWEFFSATYLRCIRGGRRFNSEPAMEYAGTYVLKQMDCVMTKNRIVPAPLHFPPLLCS